MANNSNNVLFNFLPISVLTDSYKASHFEQYPEAKRMVAYGSFRKGFEGDDTDTRIVWYGIQYILKNFIERKWTMEDVEKADAFYSMHLAPNYSAYPYPKDLFVKFIHENDGYMPIKLEALPEGMAIAPHVPVFQITADEPYAHLCTFFETLLVQTWYPSTVATLSRRAKDIIADAFDVSVDDGRDSVLLPSRLHDFGFRGCTCVEQSVLGGVAHLLNFDGTDTLSAAYYAQFELNNGKPVGMSIPATEHSVMTSWPTERDAIENMISKFGTGLFATVMDSYDYQEALDVVVPSVSRQLLECGATGYWVLRPDSGDPCHAVLAALRAGEKTFGVEVNKKGYKITKHVGVIQGDGIDIGVIQDILKAALAEGFSAQNIAFGMGGGLLQKVNRDSLSMAVKLNYIQYADGTASNVMKCPSGDPLKASLPGELGVKNINGVPTVFPARLVSPEENMLQVVYDKKPVKAEKRSFDDIRSHLEHSWTGLPRQPNVLSDEIRELQKTLAAQRRQG